MRQLQREGERFAIHRESFPSPGSFECKLCQGFTVNSVPHILQQNISKLVVTGLQPARKGVEMRKKQSWLSQKTAKSRDVNTEAHPPGTFLSPPISRTLCTSLISEGDGRFDHQLTLQALREAPRCVISASSSIGSWGT